MPVVLANNAVSRLSATLSTGATAVSITPGEGAKFPSPSVGNWFPLTIVKANGALEIVRCTSRSGDVLTVARAQEGTSAQPFSVGDRVELRLTTGAILEIQQEIMGLAEAALLKVNNLSDVDSVEAARSSLGLGTAALVDRQTSAEDTSVGRLMGVGAFGLGVKVHPTITQAQLDTVLPTGFYYVQGPSGVPAAAYAVFVNSIGDTYSTQVLVSATTNVLYFRSQNPTLGNNGGWDKAHSDKNLPVSDFVKTMLDDADGAAVRATIGAPNGVTKQMCTAWVAFNGVGVVSVYDSQNVSSVTDLGTGSFRVNFATPMLFSAYATSLSGGSPSGTTAFKLRDISGAKQPGYVDVVATNAGQTGFVDPEYFDVTIHGGR